MKSHGDTHIDEALPTLVDVYMLGLQPVPDKLATVQGRQAITRLQVKLQTTLLRCSFARYRERQNLAIFKFR